MLEKKRTRTGSKLFVNASKEVKFIETPNQISHGMKSFAGTWTKLHKETTHTSPLGKNDKRTKRYGNHVLQTRTSCTNEVKTRPPEAVRRIREIKREAEEAGY